jgi:hypothetical protein
MKEQPLTFTGFRTELSEGSEEEWMVIRNSPLRKLCFSYSPRWKIY